MSCLSRTISNASSVSESGFNEAGNKVKFIDFYRFYATAKISRGNHAKICDAKK